MIETARTTRPVTFRSVGSDRVARDIRTLPAGTEVFATETRTGFSIRVPGTLLEQTVGLAAIEPF